MPPRHRVPIFLADAEPPAPGIYQQPGRMHGCRCLVAYDRDGELTFRNDENAYAGLVDWLHARGVEVDAPPLAALG